MNLKERILLILALTVGFFAVFGASSLAQAAGVKWSGPYPAKLVKVLDGDTIRVKFLEGPCGMAPCPGQVLSIRLRGWDAPEIHQCHGKVRPSCAACPAEYQLGLKAKEQAKMLLTGKDLEIRNVGPDAYYGRVVASISFSPDGKPIDLGEALKQAGLVEQYDPGSTGSFKKEKGWCPVSDVTPPPIPKPQRE